jgi:hypothetical protein
MRALVFAIQDDGGVAKTSTVIDLDAVKNLDDLAQALARAHWNLSNIAADLEVILQEEIRRENRRSVG